MLIPRREKKYLDINPYFYLYYCIETNRKTDKKKENQMKQCRTILDIHTQEQCSNQTNKSYDYQHGKGSMPMKDIAICNDCLEKVDTTAHLHFKHTEGKS